MSDVLREALDQKIEQEAAADILYGVGTPERAAYEERFRKLRELDLSDLLDILKERLRGQPYE